jgi:uncharacterized protein YheU (UPF0270 family)
METAVAVKMGATQNLIEEFISRTHTKFEEELPVATNSKRISEQLSPLDDEKTLEHRMCEDC